ncbi:DoxX family protein [Nocardioides massiliensis]|uniref:Oxidoreductase n=1 Tax=Nocardioides massiliensis TaxID=1325935 RepID=A0ABT9NK76_9ACTN|nr:DoxX family protein [Nocardioides massiliensis]MDP9820821.1 putative oxidoreductase [Nocardioides massiliensis]
MDHDLAALLLRFTVGTVFVAHGWNHGFGPGGLDGTTGWFRSIGLQPPRLQAALSSYAEIAVGFAFIAGAFTSVAAAVAVGIMATAFFTVHRTNGFFIFRDGYEYVLLVAAAAVALATLGPGRWSVDNALALDLSGGWWALSAALSGIAASISMLAVCWRPPPASEGEAV